MPAIRLISASLVTSSIVATASVDESHFYFDTPTAEITADYFGYFEDSPFQSRDHFFQGELMATLRMGTEDRRWLATATPQLRYENADKVSGGFDLIEDENTRPFATFKELTVAYFGDRGEFVVGKQIFNWSMGDLFKPVNRFQPVDYLDVPTAESIGQLAITYRHYFDWVSVEAVVLPMVGASRLPETDNRWFNGSDLPAGVVLPALETRRDLPASTLDNVQYGLKLSSSTILPGVDLTASYFNGHDPNGILRPGTFAPTLVITQEFAEYQQFAGGFSTTRGDFEFHGEAAYHDTSDNDEDDDYIQYVAGLNYTVPQTAIGSLERVVLTFEYAGESVTRDQNTPARFLTSVFGRGLEDSLLGEALIEFTIDTRLSLGAAFNRDDSDFSTRAELTHRFNDTLTAEASVIFFSGDPDTFFGAWEDNGRFSLSVVGYF